MGLHLAHSSERCPQHHARTNQLVTSGCSQAGPIPRAELPVTPAPLEREAEVTRVQAFPFTRLWGNEILNAAPRPCPRQRPASGAFSLLADTHREAQGAHRVTPEGSQGPD